jgi:hypothetical protein
MDSIKELVQELRDENKENPLSNSQLIYKNIGVFEVHPFDGKLLLNFIKSFEKGTGAGSKILSLLCSKADKYHVTLELDVLPIGDEGLNLNQLKDFYRRYGFKDRGNDVMQRKPR